MSGQAAAVVEAILGQIDAGRLLPGAPINERDLQDACGTSRTPVREALIQLETQGLVVRHPRKGAVLFRPDVQGFLTILEVHAHLEAQAAELAARRLTDALAIELSAAVAACQAHADSRGAADPAGYYQLNLTFHEVIARASANPVLVDMIKTNARKLMAYYRLRYRSPGASEESARDHALIAGHILAHRSTEARAAMAAHFDYDQATIMDLIASLD